MVYDETSTTRYGSFNMYESFEINRGRLAPRYRSIMQELLAKATLENFSYELMAATLSMRICEDTQEVESTSVLFSFMQGKAFTENEVEAASVFP